MGLSADWHRPSNFVGKYLQQHDYRIVPVNPRYDSILGERCYKSLEEIEFAVDMVDVFRRTEDVLPIARQALQIGARCLWQQIGVRNAEADGLRRWTNDDLVPRPGDMFQERLYCIRWVKTVIGPNGKPKEIPRPWSWNDVMGRDSTSVISPV